MRKFGELSREEKINLLTAWVDGASIETYSDFSESWRPIPMPIFMPDVKYRISEVGNDQ